ncbi:MAG: CDP-4-dehydro-6-deoxyglucose reductase, partial [Gammaproteobacteria bacterium]
YLHERALGWAAQANITYTAVLSDPEEGEDSAHRRGFVHEAVLADHADLAGHDVYASGPPIMVKAIRDLFPAAGMDPDRLYYDSFEYAFETGYDQ